jgi:hypothetical protein
VNVLASPLSGSSHLIVDVFGVLLVVFWLALGYWTFRDAKRRIEEPFFIGLATLVGLFPPFVGPFIYMLFRPPEFIDDRRERELEIRAIESRLAATDVTCRVCHADVDPSFLVCPVCTTKLRQACTNCKAPLEPMWQVCPYCETPMQMPSIGAAPAALGTRRAEPTARRRTR